MEVFLDVLLPIVIGVIMLGIGLDLSIADFKRVFVAPKAVLFGLFGQLIILPLIGFLIAFLFPLDPVNQLGIVLIAACPGGTSSNIVSYMLKGNVALSVSITAFNSFLIVLTIPLILDIAFATFWTNNHAVTLSIWETFSGVIFTVLLPVFVGVLIHRIFPSTVQRIKQSLRYILPAMLFVVFLLVFINEQNTSDKTLIDYSVLFLPALLLNVGVMIIGFYTTGFIKLPHRDKFTIAIEMGLQNSALGIFLANNIIEIEGLSLISVIYGSFSFFSTLVVAFLMSKYGNRKKALKY